MAFAMPLPSPLPSPSPRAHRLRAPVEHMSLTANAAHAQQARVTRYYEQIRDAAAALGPDLLNGRRHSSQGSPGVADSCPLELGRAELKRSKFAFSDADMKNSLIKGCVESVAPWNAIDEARKNLWEDAKRQKKAVKNACRAEEEVHKELHRSLADAFDEAREAASSCTRELDMLQSQQDLAEIGADQHVGEGEDLDLCPSWANGPHSEAAEEARRGTDELSRVASLREVELVKRSQLEFEVQRLEQELKQAQDRTGSCQQDYKQHKSCADSLDMIRENQLQLGFPDITFTDDGTVVLSGHSAIGDDEALRTLAVDFNEDGQLTRATPHTALGLQREAAEAVKRDDLPWLLTLAWHRICDPAEQKRRRPSRGGA